MERLGPAELRELLAEREGPCISLYQPTHRSHPDNQQDPIRFRNLLKQCEASLKQQYAASDVQSLLGPLRELADDVDFWKCTRDGLAIFRDAETFRVHRLQRTVPELAVVANSFHGKPLLRIMQSALRYQVLLLNRDEIRLLEGDRYALDEVPLAEGVPRHITDALGEELTEPHLTVGAYGQSGRDGPGMFHGHGSKKDEVDDDVVRWFRAVDRAILEHHSRPSGLPLLLVALPEYHGVFRQLARNPFVMDVGVELAPGSRSADELREAAWRAVEPQWRDRLRRLEEEFAEARSKRRGSEDLSDVAQAMVQGRVGKLVIDADRTVPGTLDAETGRIEFRAGLDDPAVDDLLDELAAQALRTGSEVVVVPSERMPTQSGVAAIYRY